MQQKFESQMKIIRNEERYAKAHLNESILEAIYSLAQEGLHNEQTQPDGHTIVHAVILTNEKAPDNIPFFVKTALALAECDLNIKDKEGNTALHTLFDSFSKYIGSRGEWGTPKEVGNTGKIISHYLAHDILPTAAILVASGSDVNARNNNGLTPYEILEDMTKTLTRAELAVVKKIDTSVGGLISHYNAKCAEVLSHVSRDGEHLHTFGVPKQFCTVSSFNKLKPIDEDRIRSVAAEFGKTTPATVTGGHAERVQANRAQAADVAKKGCCTIL